MKSSSTCAPEPATVRLAALRRPCRASATAAGAPKASNPTRKPTRAQPIKGKVRTPAATGSASEAVSAGAAVAALAPTSPRVPLMALLLAPKSLMVTSIRRAAKSPLPSLASTWDCSASPLRRRSSMRVPPLLGSSSPSRRPAVHFKPGIAPPQAAATAAARSAFEPGNQLSSVLRQWTGHLWQFGVILSHNSPVSPKVLLISKLKRPKFISWPPFQ
mmetsp:Transcript_114050/g.308092  ORF Transcript_114050/g.308092 Transcript_114050/m.308092 type:complete len:217 (-) Transcript_114050:1172-1822(-)